MQDMESTSSFPSSLEFLSAARSPCPAWARPYDHQSPILLAIGSNIIDLIQLYAIAGLTILRWEWHGKIGEATSLAKCSGSGEIDRHFSKSGGVGPLSWARSKSDQPSSYTPTPQNIPCRFVSQCVGPDHE
jgi:hypothetical protein